MPIFPKQHLAYASESFLVAQATRILFKNNAGAIAVGIIHFSAREYSQSKQITPNLYEHKWVDYKSVLKARIIKGATALALLVLSFNLINTFVLKKSLSSGIKRQLRKSIQIPSLIKDCVITPAYKTIFFRLFLPYFFSLFIAKKHVKPTVIAIQILLPIIRTQHIKLALPFALLSGAIGFSQSNKMGPAFLTHALVMTIRKITDYTTLLLCRR